MVQYRVQDSFQEKVQDKVGLQKFAPKFFFLKKLKMSCMVEKLWEKIPLKKFSLRKSLVQERVQDKVQDKVGLGKFSPFYFFFFLQKALKCHVWWRNCEKNPFKNKNCDLENLWSNTESKTESKTRSKTNLENLHQLLKMSCLVKNCENFWFKTVSKTRSKTKLDLENCHQFCFPKALKCHV